MNEFDRNEIERSIPDRFDRQAAKCADRIAVKTRNHALTYDALNKMANRVAWAVVARQGDGNEPIAMLIESDAPMMAAMIGLLKAGKICVSLDPSHPQTRITGSIFHRHVSSSTHLEARKRTATATTPFPSKLR